MLHMQGNPCAFDYAALFACLILGNAQTKKKQVKKWKNNN